MFRGWRRTQSEAESFEAPAITLPANSQHRVGKIVRLDLETTDLARAKQFYAAVSGWKIRNYHLRGADCRRRRGREALLSDPEGVRFAVETSSSGDPAEESVFYQKMAAYSAPGAPSSGGVETIQLFHG